MHTIKLEVLMLLGVFENKFTSVCTPVVLGGLLPPQLVFYKRNRGRNHGTQKQEARSRGAASERACVTQEVSGHRHL